MSVPFQLCSMIALSTKLNCMTAKVNKCCFPSTLHRFLWRDFLSRSFSLHIKASVQFSCSVVSDSLWPQHTRPPCPLPTPGVHPNPCPLSKSIHRCKFVCFYNNTNESLPCTHFYSFLFRVKYFRILCWINTHSSNSFWELFNISLIDTPNLLLL